MLIFDRFKTTNPIVNAIITTVLISALSFCITLLSFSLHTEINITEWVNDVTHFFNVPNKIKICGKNCTNPTSYGQFYISAAYSDGFNAMLDYIINNISTTTNIKEIRELFSNKNDEGVSQFIVSQKKAFFIEEDIFINIINTKEECGDESKKTFQIENIVIEVFSYKHSLGELKLYFDKILIRYKETIRDERANKKFIYSVDKMVLKDDENHLNRWREDEYKSNRTFNNLFFEGKTEILKKIDFFMNNKSWYDEKGIPYNLGIGLHGPPGTGKTSFIKALANKTNRDIVVIPLKLIKTLTQLKTIFYEDTYARLNTQGSKSFENKIIVFEDIDCIGDIVKKRNVEPALVEEEIEIVSKCANTKLKEKEKLLNELLLTDPITLDDFLNLWDGVRETPGRIIIITSNFYSQLDPALIRPGRIDIGYELSNVSHGILQEMHMHFFKKQMDDEDLSHIQSFFYSPAELVNLYLSSDFDEKKYVDRLKENKKV